MTDFTPTHRTVNTIRYIKAGTPIKVARYTDGMMWSVLNDLGFGNDEEIGVRYLITGDAEIHYGGDVLYVLPDDYVITDGKTFAVSSNDSGWDLLTKQTPEGVSLSSWGSGIYTLRGDAGGEIRLAASQLYELIQVIQNRVPRPSPIKDARFITAFNQTKGEYQVLAKFDDTWYDDNGTEHTEEQVLDSYDEIEVIR